MSQSVDPLRPFVASLPTRELLATARTQLIVFSADDCHPRQLHAICAELVVRHDRLLSLLTDLIGELGDDVAKSST